MGCGCFEARPYRLAATLASAAAVADSSADDTGDEGADEGADTADGAETAPAPAPDEASRGRFRVRPLGRRPRRQRSGVRRGGHGRHRVVLRRRLVGSVAAAAGFAAFRRADVHVASCVATQQDAASARGKQRDINAATLVDCRVTNQSNVVPTTSSGRIPIEQNGLSPLFGDVPTVGRFGGADGPSDTSASGSDGSARSADAAATGTAKAAVATGAAADDAGLADAAACDDATACDSF